MNSSKTIYVIVPAYNEEKTIHAVLNSLIKRRYNIIVVDDGSSDQTFNIASKIQSENELYLYKHAINLGLGAALKTGLEAAIKKGADIVVTFDADEQHNPDDIKEICKPILHGSAEAVIGYRNFNHMPLPQRMGNLIMNALTRIFYRSNVKDSQSGLRAFSRKAAKVININLRGYGVSSEIIREIKINNIKMEEVPIKTIYTDYSLSKGTNTKEGLRIFSKMLLDIIKKV
ncbi:MAG: glycosyltransferase family 2 protein [Methanobacteriaceae archaeon]|nr:glycosyltransferase family 2 protein [Methanobacteriaceae archaeon]